MTHSARARAALAHLPDIDPAIAMLALWCEFRDAPGKTETQGEVIRIGPEFATLSLPEQTGVIAHHVLHVALRHSARRSEAGLRYGENFRPDMFDLACDALVNEALLQGGHALPRPAVRAADIVARLPPSEQSSDVLSDWDCSRLYAAIVAHSAGRGRTEEGEIERYALAQGFDPDLKGSDPDSTAPEVWAGRVDQALSAGRGAGTGIGALTSSFGDLPKPRVPWEIRLRRYLHKSLSQHPSQSHTRPARAWLARDALARRQGGAEPVFEPGLARQNKRLRLVIGVDTSSSIEAGELDLFAAEAASIARKSGAETHLLGFDTEVHFRGTLSRAEAIGAITMRRGGGTDLGPVLQEAGALDPSLIVILSDLDAPLPAFTAFPVLWAVPRLPAETPAFGDLVMMRDDMPEETGAQG